MKTSNLRLLTPAIFVLLAASVSGQQSPPARQMMMTKQVFFLFTPKVKAEINLSQSQLTKIMDAFGDTLQVEGDRVQLMLTGNQDLAEMEHAAMKVLEEPQRKRLEEIWIQNSNGLAIADDGIAKKIGLSEDQKKEADRLIDAGGNEILDLAPDGQNPETNKKIAQIHSTYGKKIEALLNEAQKKAYEELKGKPFEMKTKKG